MSQSGRPPQDPPPWLGLTFPDFRDFSDFFAHQPCTLVSFDPKLCVIAYSYYGYLP